jgi:NADH dehydrogenase FAD-containing subunit
MIYICYTLLPNLSVRRQVMDTTDLSDFTLMVFKLSDLILPMLVVLFFSRMTRSHFRMLAENKLADVETTLVTPSTHQTYSGMLPGWMAGHYTLEQCQIDLRPLADAAQIHMELGSIVDVDAGKQFVVLQDGRVIAYDFLSLDIGCEINTSWLEMAGEKLLPVKPLDRFSVMWLRVISDAGDQPGYRLVIVGGGAAGVELALAARHALPGSFQCRCASTERGGRK